MSPPPCPSMSPCHGSVTEPILRDRPLLALCAQWSRCLVVRREGTATGSEPKYPPCGIHQRGGHNSPKTQWAQLSMGPKGSWDSPARSWPSHLGCQFYLTAWPCGRASCPLVEWHIGDWPQSHPQEEAAGSCWKVTCGWRRCQPRGAKLRCLSEKSNLSTNNN